MKPKKFAVFFFVYLLVLCALEGPYDNSQAIDSQFNSIQQINMINLIGQPGTGKQQSELDPVKALLDIQ